MKFLKGIISNRLRKGLKTGEITPDMINPRRAPADPPKPSSVRNAEGHGLGQGATRRRSGPGARTTD